MDVGNYRSLLLEAVFVQIIVGTVCEYPYNQCGYCDCCAGACDVANNYSCDYARCIDGYWGDPQCLHRCFDDDPCLACGQTGGKWCSKCSAGFYVPAKEDQRNGNAYCTCNSRCKTSIKSETECQICNNGYANNGSSTDCPYTCPSNCDFCSSHNVCSGCKPGFHDVSNNCDKSCSSNCFKTSTVAATATFPAEAADGIIGALCIAIVMIVVLIIYIWKIRRTHHQAQQRQQGTVGDSASSYEILDRTSSGNTNVYNTISSDT